MAKKYRDLRERMSPESRRRAQQRTQEMLAEMPLYQLRQALQLSQDQLATELRIGQSSISKLERRTDMYISTLRRFVEAMGGKLEINACFDDGCVRINQFKDLSASSVSMEHRHVSTLLSGVTGPPNPTRAQAERLDRS